ncbi:High-affinity branched-chain amino acid transport system permease protein LivH [Actinomadura rubteroloni]|uniref:High-affinity branched-chain amino acid transport system permease protein LivH n=1 Tax=Actinomadura rubteroloni TaxID=1926885 RepID=A0A2P4UDB9_9ACTN|nr:branched-chain amino acid ABC transporter permease [Actinomadura rubteroloni]POM23031.1 High-affinity branched-chain amino acid transport system permease protein LivH [Actinomadura rubteroloni]
MSAPNREAVLPQETAAAVPSRIRRIARHRHRTVPVLLLLAALVAPFQLVPFRVFQLTMVFVYALALLGLNLLVGHTGQISLGHGGFFAVGSYTAAVMMDRWDVPYLLTLPAAAALAFAVGLALGVPVLRLRGLYLALVTMSIAIFLVPLLKRFGSLTGGSMGLTLAHPEAPSWTGLAQDQWLYFAALAVTAACALVNRSLLRSRVGRALHAVRDNEAAAEVMGVRPAHYKTLAFAWSAMFAGAAGAVNTWVIAFVSPDSFTVNLSIMLLAGIVIGGLGSTYGPLLGGAFVMYVPTVAQGLNEAAPNVVFGVLIIAVMYVAPTGLAGLAGRAGRSFEQIQRKK